jgi:hypothetical protein
MNTHFEGRGKQIWVRTLTRTCYKFETCTYAVPRQYDAKYDNLAGIFVGLNAWGGPATAQFRFFNNLVLGLTRAVGCRNVPP